MGGIAVNIRGEKKEEGPDETGSRDWSEGRSWMRGGGSGEDGSEGRILVQGWMVPRRRPADQDLRPAEDVAAQRALPLQCHLVRGRTREA